MKQYYPILIKHKLNTDYLIWHTNSDDGIICHESKLKKFTSIERLQSYADKNLIKLEPNEQLTTYNFNQIEQWLKGLDNNIQPKQILDVWNLMIDMAASLRIDFTGDKDYELRNRIYSRLYDLTIWKDGEVLKMHLNHLNNWKNEEVIHTKKILQEGIDIYESH